MKKTVGIMLLIFHLMMLSGCWGGRLVQGQTFVTGLGFDFKDNQYIVTFQALNFSNIAKQEGGSLVEAPPVLIGQASGASIQSALSKLEQEAPLPIYLGHVISIVLSKNIIEKQLKNVKAFISQKSLLRYNTWLFGTEEDIKDIFTSESFFNLPTLYTVLDLPQLQQDRKNLTISNIKYLEYVSRYDEPVGSVLIPSLAMNEENYEEAVKKKIAYVNGAYILSDKKYNGFVTTGDLVGVRWLDQKNDVINISFEKEKVNLDISKSQSSIKVLDEKELHYKIKIHAVAIVEQNEDSLGTKEIKKLIEDKIKDDVKLTLTKSTDIDADLLNITEKAFRFHSKQWDIKEINEIKDDSVKEIDVDVYIQENQTYKR